MRHDLAHQLRRAGTGAEAEAGETMMRRMTMVGMMALVSPFRPSSISSIFVHLASSSLVVSRGASLAAQCASTCTRGVGVPVDRRATPAPAAAARRHAPYNRQNPAGFGFGGGGGLEARCGGAAGPGPRALRLAPVLCPCPPVRCMYVRLYRAATACTPACSVRKLRGVKGYPQLSALSTPARSRCPPCTWQSSPRCKPGQSGAS